MSVLKFRNPNYTEGGSEEKWITLPTGGGIEEAPEDGNQYVRQDGEWAEVIVPTSTSDLTNDSGFITQIPSEYVTESELESALSEIDVPAGFIAQDSEPTDTDVLWIDTDDGSADVNNAISVDAYMSDTSTNPVQNQVVKGYIDGLFQVVTEAEYEALGDAVNTNGVFYFITE